MALTRPVGRGKVLDFDIENRPLTYWQPDRPTAEITSIASCWNGDLSTMEVLLLGEMDGDEMLRRFLRRYNEADLVTGHYVRKHDLPIINGALMEFGLPQLRAKLVSDTKVDMMEKADIPATQEYLAEILGCPIKKVHMTQADWREANRLTAAGLEKTRQRVTTDVIQHVWIRAEMIRRGMISGPRTWNPGGGFDTRSFR